MSNLKVVLACKDPEFRATLSGVIPDHPAGQIELADPGLDGSLVQDQGGVTVMKRLILLLAAATALVMLALPGFAQSSYTWQLQCYKNAAANGSAGTGVTWAWLHDGVQISFSSPPNGFAACVSTPLSGSGV